MFYTTNLIRNTYTIYDIDPLYRSPIHLQHMWTFQCLSVRTFCSRHVCMLYTKNHPIYNVCLVYKNVITFS